MSRYSPPATGPVTSGALVGGAAIAGALAAGIANWRAAMEANYDRYEAAQLRHFLRHAELMRARDQIMLGREIRRLHLDNERLKRDVVIKRARGLPR